MPHQNALFRTDMIIHAEIAVPVGDTTIYCTMPFQQLPQAGDQIWLLEEVAFVVDHVEHIFHQLKPPYITIVCRRFPIKERDAHINFLNSFGFSESSSYAKHVE